jgi:hypothetical protein
MGICLTHQAPTDCGFGLTCQPTRDSKMCLAEIAPSGVESALVGRREKASVEKSKDQDRGKGAMEEDPQSQGEGGNTTMQGQLGHRDEDSELKNADSDLSG